MKRPAFGLVVAVVVAATALIVFARIRSTDTASVPPRATPDALPSPTITASPSLQAAGVTPGPDAPAGHKHHHRHERYHPTGRLIVAQGHDEEHHGAATYTYSVEVEDGIKEDPDEFAEAVDDVLFDHRSWPGSFARVDHGPVDFHVVLASPDLTDQLCAPLVTAGIYSCYEAGNSVLNDMRWKHGAASYGHDLKAYRIYMINHEVGHAIGHQHELCPAAGAKAPVMMQQTKGVSPCVPNPWP